jgi:hypothetical protein
VDPENAARKLLEIANTVDLLTLDHSLIAKPSITEFRDWLNGQSLARSVTRSCRELVVRLAQVDDANRYQHQHRKGG